MGQCMHLIPRVVCEVFDYDDFGSPDFLGRVTAAVQIRTRTDATPPELDWFEFERKGEVAGQMLAAFELIPIGDCPQFPLSRQRRIREEATKLNKVRYVCVCYVACEW